VTVRHPVVTGDVLKVVVRCVEELVSHDGCVGPRRWICPNHLPLRGYSCADQLLTFVALHSIFICFSVTRQTCALEIAMTDASNTMR